MYNIETTIDRITQNEYEELQHIVPIHDYASNYIVTATINDAAVLEAYFSQLEQFIAIHPLIACDLQAKTRLFSDYGFSGVRGDYLFIEEVAIFTLIEGSSIQKQMATYQIEEDLIATTNINGATFFIIDINKVTLIEKYAHAYDIEVSFFQLDKLHKND